MGGKQWTRSEEAFFWKTIIPRSPKSNDSHPISPAASWDNLAALMQDHFEQDAPRQYTSLMLSEHFFQNAVRKQFSPNARSYVEAYLAKNDPKDVLPAHGRGRGRGQANGRAKRQASTVADAEHPRAKRVKKEAPATQDIVEPAAPVPLRSLASTLARLDGLSSFGPASTPVPFARTAQSVPATDTHDVCSPAAASYHDLSSSDETLVEKASRAYRIPRRGRPRILPAKSLTSYEEMRMRMRMRMRARDETHSREGTLVGQDDDMGSPVSHEKSWESHASSSTAGEQGARPAGAAGAREQKPLVWAAPLAAEQPRVLQRMTGPAAEDTSALMMLAQVATRMLEAKEPAPAKRIRVQDLLN